MRLTKTQAAALGIEIAGERAWIKKRRAGTPAASPGVPSAKKAVSQARLAELLRPIFGDRLREDYRGAIPGRRFEIDLALPDIRFGIEVDGWQYHGKYKESFLRDREKDWLAALAGWQIVRASHRMIMDDPEKLAQQIQQLVTHREQHLNRF